MSTGESQARELGRGELALELMLDGYLLIDGEGRVAEVNRAAAELFEHPPENMIGRKLIECVTALYPSFDQAFRSMADGSRLRFEAYIVTHKGHRRDLRLALSRVRVEDAPFLVGVFHDITDEKRAAGEREELMTKLQQQHRLHSLGTLAGGVAHEINNPVQSIISFSELLKRENTPDQTSAFADEILEAARRIAMIVRNLSTFARTDTQRQSAARMEDIVESSLGLLRHALARDAIGIEVDLPTDLPPVRCRSQQIREVLVNVLSNSRDALNAKFAGPDPDKNLRISAEQYRVDDSQWLRLTVEDHGEGIRAEHLGQVFDPFFTTRQALKRAGLGLAVSHGIMMEHRGNLRVEAEPGQTTRVHLELPVEDDPQDPSSA